jgi:hypothetical protein
MKQGSLSKETARGTTQERKVFRDCITHYELAKNDLDARIPDWDKKDELFRSFIDETKWPYQSVVFDPRVFTAIFEKTARLMANKPRGRMVPREGGDAIGAKINNELLSFQWDENERVDSTPMLAKWAMMDQNARKYGASFALVKWQYQTCKKKVDGKLVNKTTYDGPDFKPLINRDCLANPSYSSVKSWFDYREYVTLKELEYTNDSARTEPVYKNLDLLRDALDSDEAKGADTRQSNWTSKNKSIKGLEDFLGSDTTNKTIEVVTEYSPERWVTFAPKHGVILRDIPNPMDHGQIPIVQLKYYPVDDDLYGLSEIEPVERLQRAINALLNQYLDNINISLYTPLKIRATGVQMHTIEFGPGKKWIMNDPTTDVVPFQTAGQGVQEFASTYRFLVSAMQEALGETSAISSGAMPGAPEKTATEIKSSDVQRNARDNYNQMYLSEALKKQMLFWHSMDRQFLFSDPSTQQKVIRIVGKEALRYFQGAGLDKESLSHEAATSIAGAGAPDINDQEFATPNFPVNVDGEMIPKMTMDDTGEMGTLVLEPEDLMGEYDYVPDVESMSLPSDAVTIAAQRAMVESASLPVHQQALALEGYKIKLKELEEDYYAKLGLKDADKYYEKLPQQPAAGGMNATNAPGGISPQGQPGVQGPQPNFGMGQAQPMA